MEDVELQRILQEKMKRMSSAPDQKNPILRLTESNFAEYSRGPKPLFVDFWAEWCGPCKIMEPVVEKLAARYSDRILFGKVNVDEEMNLSSRFQVFSIPTFMLFKNGQPLDTVIGAVGEVSLEQLLRRALNGASAYA